MTNLNDNFPIFDLFDDKEVIDKTALHKAAKINEEDYNKHKINTALFLFYREVPSFLTDDLTLFYEYKNGSNLNKVYLYKNKFAIAFSPLGGPAAAGLMEELGFLGITNFFACGSAGQIDFGFDSKQFLLVEKAIRDEGVSYKYIPASIYVETSNKLNKFISEWFLKHNLTLKPAITWTTDAFFRETPKAIAKRTSQGAISVEMECASLCAVAKFRGYNFSQVLYFSDAVKQFEWDLKEHRKSLKEEIVKTMTQCLLDFSDR
ncbi:MAG: nucleoside phosphorylase [Spirochaetales bacterium]